jgi:hypothetical protein
MEWAGFWLGLGIFFAAKKIADALIEVAVIKRNYNE